MYGDSWIWYAIFANGTDWNDDSNQLQGSDVETNWPNIKLYVCFQQQTTAGTAFYPAAL